MSDDLKILYRTPSSHVAHMLRQVLQDYEISASVPLTTGNESPVEVMVHAEHWELATRIVAAFDKHILAVKENDDQEDEEFHFWLDWPVCPNCKTPRQTKCQFCQTAGTDFVLADTPPIDVDADATGTTDEDLEYDVMLLCHTCDEPFEPIFYRTCPWCKYEFDDGYEQLEEVVDSEWTQRTIGVVVGLTALVLATLIYVWLVY